MRHRTTGPVRGVSPVAPIARWGRSVGARLMLSKARQFYRRQLRARAAAVAEARDAPAAEGLGEGGTIVEGAAN